MNLLFPKFWISRRDDEKLEILIVARKRHSVPTPANDPRAKRTMLALQAAFLELIERMPFEEIAIKDITQAAGVSYPTFFRRCASKADLLNSIATKEVQVLLALGREALLTGATSLSMFEHVASHRKLWRTLLTGGAKSAVRDEFLRISENIAVTHPTQRLWVPLELSVPIVASGILEVLTWWLRQPDDFPVKVASDYYDSLVVAPIMVQRSMGNWLAQNAE